MIDLHNHLIPGVDDGARDPAEGVAAVAKLGRDGVTRVVTTPHVDGSLTLHPQALERRLAELDAGLERLQQALAAAGDALPPVSRGVELKLDVPEVELSDPRLRLDGRAAALVEFAFMTVPPRSADVLAAVRRSGYEPVLAHPERYQGVGPDLAVVEEWLAAGAWLQVNAGSFLGRYGERPRKVAMSLLERGWIHCVSSDFHSRGEPFVARARALLEEQGAAEQAALLFETNAERLLRGEGCVAVPPPGAGGSFWRRLLRGG